MSRLIAGARSVFRRHPFVANSAIYGSLYVAAEFSQQYVSKRWLAVSGYAYAYAYEYMHLIAAGANLIYECVLQQPEQREDIDYATVGRYAVMGTTLYAPSLYAWFVCPTPLMYTKTELTQTHAHT